MASPDLSVMTVAAPEPPRSIGVQAMLAIILAAISAMTLVIAGLSALSAYLEPRLVLHPHTQPDLTTALKTWIHNVRVAGWPLLFVAIGVHRARWRRQFADILLGCSVVLNASLVGAAVAAGGHRIFPYLPHLPFEWAALATSATGWLLASRSTLSGRQLRALIGCFLLLLALAALLETYAVPHL